MNAFAKHQSDGFINTLVRVSDGLIENILTDRRDNSSQCAGNIERRGNDWYSTEFMENVHTGEFDAEIIAKKMSALFIEEELIGETESFELL